MNIRNNKVINLKIKTLSPVAILDGDKLSPYIEVVNDKKNKKIIVLDIEKMNDIFSKDERRYNKYLNILKNKSANSRDKYSIESFLNDNNIKLESVKLKEINYKFGIRNVTEISTCIKSKGYPFIPGSTLKGAIRTSVLFNKIDETHLNKLINASKLHNYIGEDVFRKYAKNVSDDIFKNLIIRDTDINKDLKTELVNMRSFNLYKCIKDNKFELDMPQLIEAIDKEKCLNSQLIIKNNAFNEIELYTHINSYYATILEDEINRLEKLDLEEKNILINQCNILLNKINEFKINKNGFIMRIGKNKGFFYNTLDEKLSDKELYEFIDKFNKKHRGVGEFPTTRWVSCDEDSVKEMIGWIEVRVVE